MAPTRMKRKSISMRDLALVASTSSTASTSSSSQVTPQDSRALVVYENNHNNVLSDVDEDDDDDNDIYYNQDEQGVVNHAEELLYFLKIQELAKRQFKRFIRGELVFDRKKKKTQMSIGIQDDLYACEDELVSKQNEMQIYKHRNLAFSSKRPHKLVNDENDKLDRKKKKQIESFGIQDDLYACEDELVSNQNGMQIYKHQKVASSSRHPHEYVYDEDDEDDEEECNTKKKQRNKASWSRRPHKAVKDDRNEDNKKKNNPKLKKIEPIITNDITERLKEHITHHLNGTNIMLVIQKKLFASDLAGNQNRLTMPCNQLETCDFLTEQEREYLALSTENEIDVPLLGPTLQMFNQSMKLVKWPINTTYSYILRTLWYSFVKENKNDLKQGATIQVWSFRKEDQNKLGLAIAVVKSAD